jgi:hypothetical protein
MPLTLLHCNPVAHAPGAMRQAVAGKLCGLVAARVGATLLTGTVGDANPPLYAIIFACWLGALLSCLMHSIGQVKLLYIICYFPYNCDEKILVQRTKLALLNTSTISTLIISPCHPNNPTSSSIGMAALSNSSLANGRRWRRRLVEDWYFHILCNSFSPSLICCLRLTMMTRGSVFVGPRGQLDDNDDNGNVRRNRPRPGRMGMALGGACCMSTSVGGGAEGLFKKNRAQFTYSKKNVYYRVR